MVWIPVSTSWVILAACGGPGRDGPDPGDSTPPPEGTTTADSGHTSDTAVPTDTGAPSGIACNAYALGTCANLVSDEVGDYVGRWVDVADVDGDGRAEALITDSAYMMGADQTTAAAYIVAARESGLLSDRADIVFAGPTEYPYYQGWAHSAVLVGAARQLVTDGPLTVSGVDVFDVPAAAGVVPYEARVGAIVAPDPMTSWASRRTSETVRWATPRRSV